MLKKSLPWVVFFGVLLLLILSTSRYAQVFDSVLWPVRFGFLVGFSILLVRSRWRHRDDSANNNATTDAAIIFPLLRPAGFTARRNARSEAPVTPLSLSGIPRLPA